jgi:hypothetical protein
VTSSAAGWATTRAIGVYYQDQDGNHRLKFNIAGTFTSTTITSITTTITGVTFKNITNFNQACAAFINSASPNPVQQCYTNPNASTIGLGVASTANTNGCAISGDVELESKPSWA